MLKLLLANLIISMGISTPTIGGAVPPMTCGTLGMDGNIPMQMMEIGTVIDAADGIIFFDTKDGNGWIIEDLTTPYVVGSEYFITFDTQGTDDIYDDSITAIFQKGV